MKRYSNKSLRSTSRLDELKAEILPVEFGHFDNSRFRRAAIAQRFLTGLPQLRLVFPPVLACSDPFLSPLPTTTYLAGSRLARSTRITTCPTNALPRSPHLQTLCVQLGIRIKSSPHSNCPPNQTLSSLIESPLSRNRVEEVLSCL